MTVVNACTTTPFYWFTAVTAGSLLLLASRADAAPSTEELDQRIRILERQIELQQEEAAAKAKDASTASVGAGGLSVKKGDFEIKLKGLVQLDLRSFSGDEPGTSTYRADTFQFRRVRPILEGSLGKLVGFRLTPEFTGNGTGEASSMVDAYIDLKFNPAYTLRAGKVKGPVGLERLQSGSSTSFIERGFPTELAPNREIGVQLQGDLFGSTVNYTLGYYNGTADGRDVAVADADSRKEVGARLFFEPFKNEPGLFQNLGFGVGSSFGSKEQTATNAGNANNYLPRLRTPGQQQFFAYRTAASAASAAAAGSTGVYADGDHIRISPQLYWYRNAFGLLGEYIASEQDLAVGTIAAGPGATTTTRQSLENEAWQVVASFVLTGEDASFRGVPKPANPYTIGGAGWGAFEIAARYGELDVDDDAFPAFANPTGAATKATSYGVGVNWYLTQNIKTALNYTRTAFEGGGGGTGTTPLDRDDEKAVFARLQLSF